MSIYVCIFIIFLHMFSFPILQNVLNYNLCVKSPCSSIMLYGPRHNKNCLWGFQQSGIQISLLSYRDRLEH